MAIGVTARGGEKKASYDEADNIHFIPSGTTPGNVSTMIGA